VFRQGQTDDRPKTAKGKWSTVAKFAVSAALIWFAFRNQDLAVLWHQVINVNRWSLVAAIAILASLTVPQTLRWSLILRI
jgi:uncharacterized membrane protein YbhN (UPF0104 family)